LRYLAQAQQLLPDGKSNIIFKLSRACQQYNTKELCDLFDHSRSSYYYQSKDKIVVESTKAIIKPMKQISLEVGYTYGMRRLQCQLVSEGYQIGIHRTTTKKGGQDSYE
jgi:hypothetical protein